MGCGRTFKEVCLWLEMSEEEKDKTWKRIESEGLALRFTTYKERAK
jgi:hypothetical protein